MNKRNLSGRGITVGIRDVDFQHTSLSIMETFYLADEIGSNFIKYTHEGVPVLVKIIKDVDGMFTNTNSVQYDYEYFQVPNPFDKYIATSI